MSLFVIALIIGVVAGLRAFMAPAAIAWLAYTGVLHVAGTWAGFMSSVWAVGIFTILVIVEFVLDQLPSTPSRKVPKQLIPRVVSAVFSTAVLAAASGPLVGIVVLGVIGVLIGTFGGAEFRARLAAAFRKDTPAAIVEDVVALALAGLAAVLLM